MDVPRESLAVSPSGTPASRCCGACTLCCRAPAIVPLGKAAGEACRHLRADGGGCSVYQEREGPEFADCVSFTCLWLHGFATLEDRPDKLGVIFAEKADPEAPQRSRVLVMESSPGAADTRRVKELIREFLAKGQTVAITNREFVIAIRPNGYSWRYAIDPADPLHSRVDPVTAPIQLTANGRPVRGRGG